MDKRGISLEKIIKIVIAIFEKSPIMLFFGDILTPWDRRVKHSKTKFRHNSPIGSKITGVKFHDNPTLGLATMSGTYIAT